MKKFIALVIVVISILISFTGCYDAREVNDVAQVIAIGIDKGKTNKLRLTVQLAVPKSIGGGGGEQGAGGGGEEATSIVTVESPTFFSGLNLMNNTLSRQLDISHAKVLIFSKELAMEGIGDIVNGFIRSREVRPTLYIVVSQEPAHKYLENVEVPLESNPAKYYEQLYAAHKYTGFTANTELHRFYLDLKSTFAQPVATLAGVNEFKDPAEAGRESSTADEKGREIPLEGDFKAGNIARSGKMKSEIMGLAVFDGPKMIGELDGEETSYFLMVTGEYEYSFITLPDPLGKEHYIVLAVKKSRQPKHQVVMKEGKPHITVELALEADIQVIQSGIYYEGKEKLGMLERYYEDYIKKGILRYLQKTSKELKSDINGFGERLKSNVLTWQEWKDINWLSIYKDASFDVKVDLKIRRPGLVIKSTPMNTSEGEVMH